jgi:RNA polymerase primary sigma factor
MVRHQPQNRARFPEDGSFGLYVREIGKSKSLSRDEEARLAGLIRSGDRHALELLVKANLRFVVSVCRNYQNQGLPLCDLINEGNLGLIRAARRFDERKNFKFISYAVWWIRQGILQALAEQSRIVKLPLNRVGTIHRVGRTQSKLEQRLGRPPNPSEIAGELQIGTEEVLESLKVGSRHLSLDAPVHDGENGRLMDLLRNEGDSPDGDLLRVSLREEIARTLATLEERERDVIRLYFGIDEGIAHTLDEIGQRMGLTRERVRQIKERAIKRLKHVSRSRRLMSYRS